MEYYIGGTNQKTCEYDDYPSDTDGCAINLGNEHEIKKKKNTLKLHLKKMIVLNQKLVSFDKMITKFVLNAILRHMGMSWITSSNKEMKCEIDKNNHQDWLNKAPLYYTSICLKLHGSMFEDFITRAITDGYNLMCSLVAYDNIQPAYEDYEISI